MCEKMKMFQRTKIIAVWYDLKPSYGFSVENGEKSSLLKTGLK